MKKTLLSWQIVSIHHTFQSFYDSEVRLKCLVNQRMAEVYAGRTKEALDLVDPSLVIADVTCVFGNFVKYTATADQEPMQVAEVS